MPFQESAESMRAKLHLGKVRPSLAIGICAFVIVVVGVGAFAAWNAFSGETFLVTHEQATSTDSPAAGEDHQGEETAPVVAVHVSGAVARPGVYELPEGSRANDAIAAAGGALEDADPNALNLARVLSDGEQVVVPTVQESEQQDYADATGQTSGLSGKVNINTASAEQLDTLPGVGESTAQKIIDDREENGPFSSPEDLKRVSGIGEKKYEDLADLITVG